MSNWKTSEEHNRYVVNHPDGWAVKKPHAERASAVFSTQKAAEQRAKEIVRNLGGGEVRIQRKGSAEWRDSDTVAPGNDPRSSRDTKH